MTKVDMYAATLEVEQRIKLAEEFVRLNKDTVELVDGDGYPTEEALEIVCRWPFTLDKKEFFEFIKSIWWRADWGWDEGEEDAEYTDDPKVYRYYISTGGWSGNESIIQAIKKNEFLMWSITWVQSRRGGHYIFEVKDE